MSSTRIQGGASNVVNKDSGRGVKWLQQGFREGRQMSSTSIHVGASNVVIKGESVLNIFLLQYHDGNTKTTTVSGWNIVW